MVDVTDATFEADVMEKSKTVPVVVDLWAPWCGPCKQLGPIIERVIDATGGKVILAKVNVDENPAISQAFQVQSIPAVHAIVDGQVVDSFMGAQGEPAIQEFVDRLAAQSKGPVEEAPSEVEQLVAAGDESSLRRAIGLEPDHPEAVSALALLLVESDRAEEGLGLLERIPETPETRRISALARAGEGATDDVDAKLGALLEKIPGDDDARQQFVDLLELLGPTDPRTGEWRKKLTAKLF
jgi:putative thioredoxin